MRVGKSYKQTTIDGAFDAIVVGSGPGGLTAAALLARHACQRVLVLERHYTAGGFTHTFKRPGYEWDVGVHYIGEVHREGSMMRHMFDHVTDGTLEWESMGHVVDKIHIGDDVYDLVEGREAFIEKLAGYFPEERDAIERYVKLLHQVNRAAKLFYAEKVLPPVLAGLVGGLLRRSAKKFFTRTTDEVLREITSNARLRAVLAGQFGDYGLPPLKSSFFIHSMVANHYLNGAAYPVGGASRIPAAIVPLIEATGGMVITNADVEDILVEKGRAVGVRLVDGKEFRAPVIISDAGAAITINRLLPADVAERTGLKKKLSKLEASCSHISLYIGLDATDEELDLKKPNFWLYRSDDHDGNWEQFLKNPEGPLPVVYVSFPSAKDPDFQNRHPGHATIEVVVPAPAELFAKWRGTQWQKRGADYEALKERIKDRLLEVLYEQVPQVKGHVKHAELSTPLSTEQFAAHPKGEIYGLSHTRERFATRWLRPHTPIKGLFLTGADVSTAGIGGALAAGLITVSAILKRNLLEAAMKTPPHKPLPKIEVKPKAKPKAGAKAKPSAKATAKSNSAPTTVE